MNFLDVQSTFRSRMTRVVLRIAFWPTWVAALLSGRLSGQGVIVFNNSVAGQVVAPIFAPEPSDPTLPLQGNPTNGYPAGTQVYTGAALSGSSYTVELWGGPSTATECQLTALARTIFQTAPSAGFVQPPVSPVAIAGVPPGMRAQLQVRAWDNKGGTVNSWAQSECAPAARGSSAMFLSDPLAASGGQVYLRGLRSFNIFNAGSLPYHILINRGGCDLSEFAPVAFEGENVTLLLRCVQPGASLQWRLGGADIAGAHSPTLSLPNIRLNQSGIYTVADTAPPAGTVEPISINLRVAPRPRLSSPHLTPQGAFSMTLSGVTNRTVSMEQSSNLVSWASWTNLYLFGPAQVTFPGPLPPRARFFRAHPLP
ncbi:MAG: hypothetical protein QOF48_2690 [Verrucomicrobiota bacterium]|jgi:hypothetical protein